MKPDNPAAAGGLVVAAGEGRAFWFPNTAPKPEHDSGRALSNPPPEPSSPAAR